MTLIRRPTPLGELISLRNALARVEAAKPRKIKIPKGRQHKP